MKTIMKKSVLLFVFCLFSTACILLTACGTDPKKQTEKDKIENAFIPAKPGTYDSADTTVVVNIDEAKKNITFLNFAREKNYTLSYDGTSSIFDKYGEGISMGQVKEGDIVDVTFLKEKKHLNTLKMSADAFCLEDVSKFEINSRKKQLSVADSKYKFLDELLIFSKGQSAQIMDINEQDRLEIKGIGNTVYSIDISKGHGYLRLKNDEYFIGGWIEVGQFLIRTIEEDMLLVVPEGTYEVMVSTKGASGVKKVTIERDKETELDIGDLKNVEEKKIGTLIFSITPASAKLFIDGEEVDYSKPVEAEYGIHQIMVQADGYQTITQYIKVGKENATLQVTMEREDTSKKDNTVSDNEPDESTEETPSSETKEPTKESSTSSEETETDSEEESSSKKDDDDDDGGTVTTGVKVSIDAPTDVEVYINGNYIGIAPISFTKKAGTYVVTLRKDGYQTKSYTIEVDNTDVNASFSFSDLIPK